MMSFNTEKEVEYLLDAKLMDHKCTSNCRRNGCPLDDIPECPYNECDGKGFVSTYETVYQKECHVAEIGVRKCRCILEENEENE